MDVEDAQTVISIAESDEVDAAFDELNVIVLRVELEVVETNEALFGEITLPPTLGI